MQIKSNAFFSSRAVSKIMRFIVGFTLICYVFYFLYLGHWPSMTQIIPGASILLLGGLFWLTHRLYFQASVYLIGKRMNEILLITFVSITLLSVLTAFNIFISAPKERRIENRAHLITPFVSLARKHLEVSDMSELIRLLRTFEFPEGILDVTVRVDEKVLLSEEFSKNKAALNLDTAVIEECPPGVLPCQLKTVKLNLIAHLFIYHYGLGPLGPNGAPIYLDLRIDDSQVTQSDYQRFFLATFFLSTLFSALYWIIRGLSIQLLSPLSQIASQLKEVSESDSPGKLSEESAGRSLEIKMVVEGFNQLLNRNQSLTRDLVNAENESKLIELADQVAHDIRSPLSALKIVTGSLSELPDETLTLMRAAIDRINGIANNLLEEKKKGTQGSAPTTEQLSVIVESILCEKRIQFNKLPMIEIESKIDSKSLGLFVNVNAGQLKQVLSNLINNAVEACHHSGIVEVQLNLFEKDYAEIVIIDNGPGIPPELISKIGTKGITGKDKGSGLGLYLATKANKAMGGKFKINSSPQGTRVHFALPIVSPPSWYLSEVCLLAKQQVVVADDDENVHMIWKKRLKAFPQIKPLYFNSPYQLRRWVKTHPTTEARFFIDYEFRNGRDNGIDLIESLQISQSSVLVTNRDQDAKIKKWCLDNNMHLLPKLVLEQIPISSKDA